LGHAPILNRIPPVSSPQSNISNIPAARRMAAVVACAAVAAGLAVIAVRGPALGTIPIDGCYYLAKARSLAEHGTLRVPWGNGMDTKFFPGLSILFAPFIKILGFTWGWLAVEMFCYAGCAWLTAALARRLGLGPVGACAAASAFAVDPLILKWASVPYAELPATFFTLAAVEFTFRAADGPRRLVKEVAAALALGVASTMRVESLVALPAVLAIHVTVPGSIRRSVAATAASAAAIGCAAFLPLASHVAVMASLDVGPARLHYVTEFINNFSWSNYQKSLSTFGQELLHIVPESKASLVSGMPGWLSAAFAVARVETALCGLAGMILLLFRTPRWRAAFAIGTLLLYVPGHALWHYADARFLVIVWAIPCIAVAAAVERALDGLVRRPAANARGAMAGLGGALASAIFVIFVLAGHHVSGAHAADWENTTRGSARELAQRIDALTSPDATGYYEFEVDFRPWVMTGPFVAMWRDAPAYFCYKHRDFYDPHESAAAIPTRLKTGNAFALTNLSFDEWIRRRVADAGERPNYRALLESPGRTLIVYRAR
jgi:hypothetical protein